MSQTPEQIADHIRERIASPNDFCAAYAVAIGRIESAAGPDTPWLSDAERLKAIRTTLAGLDLALRDGV